MAMQPIDVRKAKNLLVVSNRKAPALVHRSNKRTLIQLETNPAKKTGNYVDWRWLDLRYSEDWLYSPDF